MQRHIHTPPAPDQAGGSGWHGSPTIPTPALTQQPPTFGGAPFVPFQGYTTHAFNPVPLDSGARRHCLITTRAPVRAPAPHLGLSIIWVSDHPSIGASWRGRNGEEAAAADGGGGAQARRRRGAGVGAAVAVGQDGLLPRRHARLAPPRLRAAAARRAPRPRPPARAPLREPPRRRRQRRLRLVRLGGRGPGARLRLPVIARRPARHLRRARAAHPLRVRGERRSRRVPVGGRGVRGRVRVVRAGQGRGRAARPRRAAGRGRARRGSGRAGGHAPALPGARRRAPRRGVPDQLPRAPAHACVQDRRRRRGEAKRRPSNTQRAEAV